jgi:HD-like signal output (HDOD) protein
LQAPILNQIDELLSRIKNLPPAPQILPPLLKALGEDDTNLDRIADMVSFDPALTAKLLTTCNSAFFARRVKIESVAGALQQLGLQTVYRIVASSTGALLFKPSSDSANSFANEWWRHSVMTAFAAQFVAEDMQVQTGAMFTAGLLQDIGRVVLLEEYKEDYVTLLTEDGLTESQLAGRESVAFGVNHSEIGGRLLEKWRFSPMMVLSVIARNDPLKAPDGNIRRMAACLHLGNSLAKSIEAGNDEVTVPVSVQILNRSAVDIVRYTDLIRENMNFVEALCRLR